MRRKLLLSLIALCFTTIAYADDMQQRKTLRRRLDHVVIEGKEMRSMLGAQIPKLRLLALKRDKLEVIPFQVDERTPSGGYAFDKGVDTKKDVDGGALDLNDELVFMVRDVGSQATPKTRESLPRHVEIQISDPKDGRFAWVYLVAYKKDPPALSPKDYVTIKQEKDGRLFFYGRDFYTGNARSKGNAVRASSLRFKNADGSLSQNVVDTTKTRAKIYYFAIPVERNGTEMRVSVGAYIDGPIRIVCLNVVEIYLLWGFWVKAPNSLIKFYEYGSEMPSNINIPINIDGADPASIARLSIDLSPRARNWYFYNSRNKTPLQLDGTMSAKELKIDKRFPDWNVVYGPEGGIITRFLFKDPALTKRKYSRLFYSDDLRKKDEPENESGSFGNVGFDIDLSGMKVGIYQGTYFTYYKPRFRYGDERRYLDIIDKPLKFTIKK